MDEPRNPALDAMIAQNPDDRQAYLVYADWLEARGEPRAKLIRAQLAEPNRRSGPGKVVRKLLADHKAHLLGPLARCPKGSFQWQLGFIRAATLDDDHEPCATRVAQLFRHPSGRFLVELRASAAELPAVIEALAGAPATLRALDLAHDGEREVELRGCEAVLRGLRSLTLRGRFALGALELPRLEAVRLVLCGLTRASERAIATAAWPRLRSLSLELSASAVELQAVIDALAGAPVTLRELVLAHDGERELVLRGCEAVLRGLRSLMLRGRFALDALELPHLEELILDLRGLTRASARAITTGVWPRLRSLSLDFPQAACRARHLAPLFSRADLPELASLELLDAPKIDRMCELLTKAPFAAQLRELTLRNITDDGAEAIADGAESFEQLEVLDVDEDDLTEDGVEALKGMDLPKLLGVSSYDESRYDDAIE